MEISGSLSPEKPGFTVSIFPRGKMAAAKKQQEGVGLIEVVNLNEPDKKPFFVVKAIDGTGSLRWMSINKGDWIPFVAIVTGHVLKEKTPASKLEFSQKLARVLNYACRDALRDLRSSQVS